MSSNTNAIAFQMIVKSIKMTIAPLITVVNTHLSYLGFIDSIGSIGFVGGSRWLVELNCLGVKI